MHYISQRITHIKKKGSDKMEAVKALQWQVAKITAGVLVLIGIGVLAIFRTDALPYMSGLMFGGGIGILMFRLLGITMEKAVKMSPGGAQAYVAVNYFIRMAIMGFVLFISVKLPSLNIFATAFGMISVKMVIYGLHVKGNNNSSDTLKGKEESH